MRQSLKYMKSILISYVHRSTLTSTKNNHYVTFLEFYNKTTGKTISKDHLKVLKRKHPYIDEIDHDRLQCTLQILHKFGITAYEACHHLHVFKMNTIIMDNYGEILKECGFITISPQHIIKYHTLIKSKTIAQLKKDRLLPQDINIEKNILDKLSDWPCSSLTNFADTETSILTVRVNVLERYLFWKLSITTEQFKKLCKNYLSLRHRPMADIQEAINLALNDINFDNDSIRRNGCIIAADPLRTKLVLENVKMLAGIDIRKAIRLEPSIMKSNHHSILQIRDIMEEHGISDLAQRKCLKVYCLRPETVRQRLEEMKNSKEYQIWSSNPRVLHLVVHKNKIMRRLYEIENAKKQCYSFNTLVSTNKIFDKYINSCGEKVWSNDIARLITSCLTNLDEQTKRSHLEKTLIKQLKKQKYWLHVPMNVIHENLHFLREKFHDQTIFNNCQILLYPDTEVKQYVNMLVNMREGIKKTSTEMRSLNYNTLEYTAVTDDQILSLALYEIEKRYHFSGDGIWSKQDGLKVDAQSPT